MGVSSQPVDYESAREAIDRVINGFAGATKRLALPPADNAGKLYEAWVLTRLLEQLRDHEGFDITLREARELRLKSAPGPINRDYAHFLLERPGLALEVWTDVEFIALSALRRGVGAISSCDFHELDIVAVPAGTNDRPPCGAILLGVECKNTPCRKDLLRSSLGVRRELSYIHEDLPTAFTSYPRATVPAYPASCLMVFSTDRRVEDFKPPGDIFGVDYKYEPIS